MEAGQRRRQRRRCARVAGVVRAQAMARAARRDRTLRQAATARRRCCSVVAGAVRRQRLSAVACGRAGRAGPATWRARSHGSRRGRVRVVWARARAGQAGARPSEAGRPGAGRGGEARRAVRARVRAASRRRWSGSGLARAGAWGCPAAWARAGGVAPI